MIKNEFLQRFKLNRLNRSSHEYDHGSPVKSAAVLISLIDDGELKVLLTKRASHLNHHAGQISFPGGKSEPDDDNLIATALREAEEEVGLSAEQVKVVGQLHPYQTISGYIVTPIVAIVPPDLPYVMDKNEVAEIFQVPLQHFLQPSNHHTVTVNFKGSPHNVTFMPYKTYNIWGATAAMLKDLAEHLR